MQPNSQRKDLSQANTLALQCVANRYAEVASKAALASYLASLPSDANLLVLGGGSNVILPEVVDRPVLKLTNREVQVTEHQDGSVDVQVGAGMHWDELVATMVALNYSGIENLSLIPGSVGAAPVQNIGAYGVELVSVLKSLEAYDRELGRFVTMCPDECDFGYRDSIFKRCPGRFIIASVTLVLSTQHHYVLNYGELKVLEEKHAAGDLTLQDVRSHVIHVRQAKLPDPSEIPNVGSFFKNPIIACEQYHALKTQFPDLVAYEQTDGRYKVAAGWLIDQAGWKGKVAGSGKVAVHDKQALVLVNKGGANQSDVLALASEIREDVLERYGVVLEIEPVTVS